LDISLENREIAGGLHAQTPVADLHLDLPGELLFRHRCGVYNIIRTAYLPLWKKAGIALVGASVYVEDTCLPENGLRNALLQILALKEELRDLEGEVHLIRCRADLDRAYAGESIGILLYLEGLDFLGVDTGLLGLLSELGVMGASLAWSRQNLLAYGCCRAAKHYEIRGKLTEEGIRAIGTMEKLHMFLDISHLNDEGTEEVLTEAEIPILATHSNARSVYFHYRNLTDGQIDLLSDRGGIIGLNGCSLLVGADRGGGLELLTRHGMYLTERAGAEHVCLGLDLCRRYELARRELGEEAAAGWDILTGYGELALLTAAFLEAGMSQEKLRKLLGLNAFAFLRRILP